MKKKLLIGIFVINITGVIGVLAYLDSINTSLNKIEEHLNYIRINRAWNNLFERYEMDKKD